jgi:serine protease Do
MRNPFLLVLIAGALAAQSQTPNPLRALSDQFERIANRTDPAVVQIITRSFSPDEDNQTRVVRASRGSGSGMIASADGYVVTNAHVIAGARRVQVLVPQAREGDDTHHSVLKPTGKLYSARVVGQDRETDIAVLKIEATGLAHLAFGDSEKLRLGQLVFAFGSPLGLENSVTMGIVSNTARQVREDDPMIYVQTDAAINPGNSGGPLVDAEGAVVGINTFILTRSGGSEGIGFAAPANIVRNVFEQIKSFGRVRRGQIGMLVQTIHPALSQALGLAQESGVLVEDVAPGGPAEAAGIQIKDIILSINGKLIENGRQFGVNIYQNAGKTVDLDILRGKERKTIAVAVLERPRDTDRILSLVQGDANRVRQLGILAVELDEKSTPMLPTLRRLTGVVVAGVTNELGIDNNQLLPGDVIHEINNEQVLNIAGLKRLLEKLAHGDVVAVQVDRQGQLQFLLLEID